MPMKTGRKRTCNCGVCRKCKQREYMRRWYQSKTPEQRRAIVQARDPKRSEPPTAPATGVIDRSATQCRPSATATIRSAPPELL